MDADARGAILTEPPTGSRSALGALTGPFDTPRGWWRIDALDRPRRIEFANGLAGDDGEPMPGVEPMAGHVTLEAADDATRVTVTTRFTDIEQMKTMLGMGMEEGMS